MKKRQEEATHQKNEFVNGQAFDLACSILNMSTSDLQDFLKDEDFKFDVSRLLSRLDVFTGLRLHSIPIDPNNVEICLTFFDPGSSVSIGWL